MKAGFFSTQGGPEVLRYADVPDPLPATGEVILRVHAAALNRLDLKAREGRPEVEPMPHIGGLDVAGEIAEVGPDQSGWTVGDRAVVLPILSCGRCAHCAQGDVALCAEQRVLGFQTQGGFAEYVAVPAANLVRVPPDADMDLVAATPTTYLTAWRMLVRRAKLRAGESVLIHSIGGGVGCAALQIARYLGARVIGTAGSDEKLARARELGADAVVNYRREDTAQAVQAFTEGRGVDVVVETVGSDTWEISLASAAKNGRVVTCGVTSGAIAPLNIRALYQRQVSILGAVMGGLSELRSIMALVALRELRPIVARRFPLAQIAEAHRALESRRYFGKIVLTP